MKLAPDWLLYQPAHYIMPANAGEAGIRRTTLSGEDCLLPISFGAAAQYDCLLLGGVPSCPTASGTWEECVLPVLAPEVQPLPAYEDMAVAEPVVAGAVDDSSSAGSATPGAGRRLLQLQAVDTTPAWLATPLGGSNSQAALTAWLLAPTRRLLQWPWGGWWGGRGGGSAPGSVPPAFQPSREPSYQDDYYQPAESYYSSDYSPAYSGSSASGPDYYYSGTDYSGSSGSGYEEYHYYHPHPDYSSYEYVYHPSDYYYQSSDYLDSASSSSWLPEGATALLGRPPRLTVSGQACVRPFRLGEQVYEDCAPQRGSLVCPSIDGEWHECAPAVAIPLGQSSCSTSSDTSSSSSSDASSSSSGEALFDCMHQLGVDYCKVAAAPDNSASTTSVGQGDYASSSSFSSWVASAAAAGGEAWLRCPLAPVRQAVSGSPCLLPFVHGGLPRADCVAVPGSMSGAQMCVTDAGLAALGATSDASDTSYTSSVDGEPLGYEECAPALAAAGLSQAVQPLAAALTSRYSLVSQLPCMAPASTAGAVALVGNQTCALDASSGAFRWAARCLGATKRHASRVHELQPCRTPGSAGLPAQPAADPAPALTDLPPPLLLPQLPGPAGCGRCARQQRAVCSGAAHYRHRRHLCAALHPPRQQL